MRSAAKPAEADDWKMWSPETRIAKAKNDASRSTQGTLNHEKSLRSLRRHFCRLTSFRDIRPLSEALYILVSTGLQWPLAVFRWHVQASQREMIPRAARGSSLLNKYVLVNRNACYPRDPIRVHPPNRYMSTLSNPVGFRAGTSLNR